MADLEKHLSSLEDDLNLAAEKVAEESRARLEAEAAPVRKALESVRATLSQQLEYQSETLLVDEGQLPKLLQKVRQESVGKPQKITSRHRSTTRTWNPNAENPSGSKGAYDFEEHESEKDLQTVFPVTLSLTEVLDTKVSENGALKIYKAETTTSENEEAFIIYWRRYASGPAHHLLREPSSPSVERPETYDTTVLNGIDELARYVTEQARNWH